MSPQKTKAAPVYTFWALVAFLVSWLSLSFPSLYSVFALSFCLLPPSPEDHLHAYKGVFGFPLWAGFSSGVRPPVQQHGRRFPIDSSLVVFFLEEGWGGSLKHPDWHRRHLLTDFSAPHTFWGLMLFSCQGTLGTSTRWRWPRLRRTDVVIQGEGVTAFVKAAWSPVLAPAHRGPPEPDRFIWVRRSRLLINCLCVEWFITMNWSQCHTAQPINYDQHL